MFREYIREGITSYLYRRSSIQDLTELVDNYDWNETSRGSEFEWNVMGTISLYLEEIGESLRTEDELREAIQQFDLQPFVALQMPDEEMWQDTTTMVAVTVSNTQPVFVSDPFEFGVGSSESLILEPEPLPI